METFLIGKCKEAGEPLLGMIGDRSTSDVVVRLRTLDGRDEWFYCHSRILSEKSKYLADRLSDHWPTCQILDSRNCVEVYCQESEFNHHVSTLRLLYAADKLASAMWHNVRNALGILRVAVQLGCQQVVRACVDYLEAVPWEEGEEEEILKTIPSLGLESEPILARLQSVNQAVVARVFISAIHFATSPCSPSMCELKSSVQEQLEYMLAEDDDPPLVMSDECAKSEVRTCMRDLFNRFYDEIDSPSSRPGDEKLSLRSLLLDLAWACRILGRMEIMKDFVHDWVNTSDKIVKAVEAVEGLPDSCMLEMRLKVVEVMAKMLEAIGYGNVILPAARRVHVVKVWLPFMRRAKPLLDLGGIKDKEELPGLKIDCELWQSVELAFVAIVVALPLGNQAEILAEWLRREGVRYPDLSEAFEVWCYKAKVAKRRLGALFGGTDSVVPNSA